MSTYDITDPQKAAELFHGVEVDDIEFVGDESGKGVHASGRDPESGDHVLGRFVLASATVTTDSDLKEFDQ